MTSEIDKAAETAEREAERRFPEPWKDIFYSGFMESDIRKRERAALVAGATWQREQSALFHLGDFTLHSGIKSTWKIECDSLTEADWACLARIASERLPPFGSVIGVPRGGLPFAKALEPYATTGPRLVVDDVWTTGASLLGMMQPGDIGLVAFARNPVPAHVTALWAAGQSALSEAEPVKGGDAYEKPAISTGGPSAEHVAQAPASAAGAALSGGERAEVLRAVETIQAIAFDARPPNSYTPRIVHQCIALAARLRAAPSEAEISARTQAAQEEEARAIAAGLKWCPPMGRYCDCEPRCPPDEAAPSPTPEQPSYHKVSGGLVNAISFAANVPNKDKSNDWNEGRVVGLQQALSILQAAPSPSFAERLAADMRAGTAKFVPPTDEERAAANKPAPAPEQRAGTRTLPWEHLKYAREVVQERLNLDLEFGNDTKLSGAALDEIDNARHTLSALPHPAPAAWRTMTDAPRDGTWFRWCLEGRQAVIRWPEYEACFEKGLWIALDWPASEQAAPAADTVAVPREMLIQWGRDLFGWPKAAPIRAEITRLLLGEKP